MNTYTLEEVRQRELEAGGRRKEKVIREKVFLSRYYPDMILTAVNSYYIWWLCLIPDYI
ncbi:MAG: hypothetical protein F6K39_13190 [Okeania sp. SIO3B3]|nr:hypothetical protein [Okeania sp. SIO3B3]